MVIECAHCQTRFKLADDKLRPEGTKVRCSKCKEIFTVFPPAAEESPPAPAPLPSAPPDPVPPPPTPTAASDIDFGTLTMAAPPAPDEGDFSFAMESVAESSPPSDMSLDMDMEDIATSSGGIDANNTSAALEESAAPAAATGVDFGEFSFDNATPAQPEPADFSAGDEANPFGEFDFSEPPATGAGAASASADDNLGFGANPAADFDFGDTPSDSTAFNFSEQPTTKSSGSGAPEDFNFDSMRFGDDASKPFSPELVPAAAPEPSPSTAKEVPPMREPLSPRASPPSRSSSKRARPLEPPPKPGSRISIVTILLTLVITLLLSVVGAALYFYFRPGLFDTRKTISDLISKSATQVEPGKISVTTQSAVYVSNQEAGDLFVIRGEAINEFKTPRTAIAVKGMLFNAQGQMLKAQTAFCGNPLSDATLASIPFKKIQEAMANQFGDSLANLDVAPGKAIPFVIVFRQLPSDLATYTVELAEVRPPVQ